MRINLMAVVAVCLLAPSFVATKVTAQGSVVLLPIKDNTIYDDTTDVLSNGSGQFLFVGQTGLGFNRRALLAFDLSSVPAGSSIDTVMLTMNMSRTISADHDVSIHRLLDDWGESDSSATGNEGTGAPAATGDATWLHASFDDRTWQNPGGDFIAAPSATAPVGGADVYTWGPTSVLNADVSAWVDNPSENFGWIVIGNEEVIASAKRFDSRNNATASLAPMLTVVYSTGTAVEDEAVTASTLLQSVYPNPFTDRSTIVLDNAKGIEVALEVVDVLGRVVLRQKSSPGRSQGEFVIDGSVLAVGVYQICVRSATEMECRSIVRL